MLLQSLRAIGRNVNRATSLCIFFVSLSAQAAAPSFETIDSLIQLRAISRDGSTIIGHQSFQGDLVKMVRGSDGPILLPPPATPIAFDAKAHAISDDGSKVVGSVAVAGQQMREACIWTGTNVQALGRPEGDHTEAKLLSGDGTVVFGTVTSEVIPPGETVPTAEQKVFRWTEPGGMKIFANPPGFTLGSIWGSTRDGSAVYGYGSILEPATTPDGGGLPLRSQLQVVRWDQDGNSSVVAPPAGHVIVGAPIVATGDGSVFVPVAPPSLDLPAETLRWMRWRPDSTELLPQLQHAGRVVNGTIMATSEDGNTQVFEFERRLFRYTNGVYTHLGRFNFSHASHDCSAIVGLRANAGTPQPVIWTESSGVVELLPRLSEQLDGVAPLGGDWSEDWSIPIMVARSGDTISCAGGRRTNSGSQTAMMEISATFLDGPDPYGGDLFAGATAAFSERYLGFTGSYQSSLTATVPLRANEAESLDRDSIIALMLGNARIRKTLGDDPNYSATRREAHLDVGEGNVLDLSWTETALVLKYRVRRINEPTDEPGGADFFLNNWSHQSNQKIVGSSSFSLRIGNRTGTRPLVLSGSFGKKEIKRGGSTVVARKLLLKGRFDHQPPGLTLFLPPGGMKQRSRFVSFNPFVSERDSTIYYRLNGGEWFLGADPGQSTALVLEPGENFLQCTAVDPSGNESRVTFPFLTFLPWTGSYTGLLYANELASGYFSLRLTEGNGFTGTVVLDGKKVRLKHDFDLEGRAIVMLTQKDGSVITMRFERIAEANTHRITCEVEMPQSPAPPLLATGVAGRTIWNSHLEVSEALGGSQFNALLRANPAVTEAPLGSGILRLTPNQVTATVKALGTLADGTPVSFSAPLSDQLDVPIFLSVRGKASLAGTLKFDPSQPESDVTGDLRWMRPAGHSGFFADGWDTTLDVIGSRFGHPGYEGLPLPLFPVRSETIGGIEQSVPSALLRFQGGALPSPLFLPIYCDDSVPLGAPLEFPSRRPLFNTLLKPLVASVGMGAVGSWIPEGHSKRVRFEVARVPKANLLGGYFVGPTGAGNVTVEALP